ncbi:hypothetical protein MFIFM68171_05668 [Madurella fahalii]|uniref:Uncharacterized protein n=1 Tax=Madurella fahalii TaxID=1157608 RepID=A0ABQ0GCJ4_9PEZI
MKFTTCAQVLSAAVIASSASVPINGKRSVQHASLHENKIKAISWDEAVQIMEEGASDFDGKVSSLTNTNEPQPVPSCTANVRFRAEWNNMANADKLSYVQAVKCLMTATPLGV